MGSLTTKKEKTKVKTPARLDLSSKFWKAFLTMLATFLMFAGPTYIVYALINFLKMDYAISMVSGFILFIIGLVLIFYMIKNKIIT